MKPTDINSETVRILKEHGGKKVAETLINRLVDAELDRRAVALHKAYTDAETISRDLKKIKPDAVTYDAEGKVVSESFTRAAKELREKSQARLTKLENAIHKATEDGEFSDLLNVASQKNDNQPNQPAGVAAGEPAA